MLLTGWRRDTPFVDPLCGSGTLPIEAAWMALRRPPGLTRKRFGFQGWMDYDVRLWTALRDEARRGVGRALPAPIVGADVRGDAVAFAINNARAAGIGHLLRFDKRDVRDFRPPDGPPGVLLCNPPYGERIGEEKELVGLYRTLGEVFAALRGLDGVRVHRQPGAGGRDRAAPAEQIPLFNGKIPCRLLRFEIG